MQSKLLDVRQVKHVKSNNQYTMKVYESYRPGYILTEFFDQDDEFVFSSNEINRKGINGWIPQNMKNLEKDLIDYLTHDEFVIV